MSAALGVNVRTSGPSRFEVVEVAWRCARASSCAEPRTISRPGRRSDNRLLRSCDTPGLASRPMHRSAPRPPHQIPDAHRAEADAALEVLLDRALEPIVDMVLHRAATARYEALAPRRPGHLPRAPPTATFERGLGHEGRNPLADQSTDKFAPLADERAHPLPAPRRERLPARLRADRPALRLARPRPTSACSTPPRTTGRTRAATSASTARSASCRPARRSCIGGQGRRNARRRPARRRASSTSRPRSPRCSAARPARRRHATSRVQDGEALTDVLDPAERPQHVVGFLFDGTNPNVLYDMAARGEAPNVARAHRDGHRVRPRRDGVAADGHAREPHVDHHRRAPGHHGILQQRVVRPRRRASRSSPTRRPRGRGACSTCTPGIESIHDAVHRTWPDAFTASVNEPCDTGADYSTFDFFRRGEVPPIPKDPFGLPHTTERFVRPVEGLLVVVGRRPHGRRAGARHRRRQLPRRRPTRMPRFMWCNFTLTDAAMHEGGPHSEMAAASVRDSDGRIGEILDGARAGAACSTTARSCSSPTTAWRRTIPAVRGDWDVALRAAGVEARDEAYGFLYFGVRAPSICPVRPRGELTMRRLTVGVVVAVIAARGVRRGAARQSSADRRRRNDARGRRNDRGGSGNADLSALAAQDAKPKIKVTYTSRGRHRLHDRAGRQRQVRVHQRQQHDLHRRQEPRSRATAPAPTAKCTDLGQPRRRGRRHRSTFTATFAAIAGIISCLDGGIETSETIAGRDASCVTSRRPTSPRELKAWRRRAQHGRRCATTSPNDSRRRSASTSRPASSSKLTATTTGKPQDEPDRDRDRRRRPTATSPRRRRRRRSRRSPSPSGGPSAGVSIPGSGGSVADLPEAQATRRGELPRRVAIAGAQDRHHVAGPALAQPDLDERPDDRRAPSASRTRCRGSRSAARRRPRRPTATRAPGAWSTSPPGPCGRTTRSRARRRTDRRARRKRAQVERVGNPPREAIAERIGRRTG